MRGRGEHAAVAELERNLELLARVGYRDAERLDALSARLEGEPEMLPLGVRMRPSGRIFGGAFGLELSSAEPVLPESGGLVGRARGAVRVSGIAFRARGRDEVGRRLAERLEADRALAEALASVHFEQLVVSPDGRPVIRHMGGSVVWILFPPLVRPVPFVEEQAHATVAALEEFARAGAALR